MEALRQEGFTRLAARFASTEQSADAVRDLAALTASYVGNALDHPDLYRVMFDATFDLEDLPAADATLEYLVQAAEPGRPAASAPTPTRSNWRPRPGPSRTGWSPWSPTAPCRIGHSLAPFTC